MEGDVEEEIRAERTWPIP